VYRVAKARQIETERQAGKSPRSKGEKKNDKMKREKEGSNSELQLTSERGPKKSLKALCPNTTLLALARERERKSGSGKSGRKVQTWKGQKAQNFRKGQGSPLTVHTGDVSKGKKNPKLGPKSVNSWQG